MLQMNFLLIVQIGQQGEVSRQITDSVSRQYEPFSTEWTSQFAERSDTLPTTRVSTRQNSRICVNFRTDRTCGRFSHLGAASLTTARQLFGLHNF